MTPVAFFGAGHRTIHKPDLQTMGWAFRKRFRKIIRPPGSVGWTRPWHDFVIFGTKKSKTTRRLRDLEIWSRKCLKQYWNLGLYIASLPTNRWVRRVLCWCPLGRRRPGNPRHHWLTKIIIFFRYKQFGNSEDVATQGETWLGLRDGLAMFCNIIS